MTLRELDSYRLPPRSIIPVSPPLKRGVIAQALIDVGCVLVGATVFVSVALGLPLSIFMLLFCELP